MKVFSGEVDDMPPKKKDDKKGEDDETKGEIGVYHFADGSKYDGQYAKKAAADPNAPPIIKRHGFGVYTDGETIYDGQWADDNMHGEGTITFDTGATYQGTFFNNVFNGRGTYKWPDGSSYEGQWRNNKMHGEGVYIDGNERRWSGKFYDNKGVELIREVA